MLEPLIHVYAKLDEIGREHIKDHIPIIYALYRLALFGTNTIYDFNTLYIGLGRRPRPKCKSL